MKSLVCGLPPGWRSREICCRDKNPVPRRMSRGLRLRPSQSQPVRVCAAAGASRLPAAADRNADDRLSDAGGDARPDDGGARPAARRRPGSGRAAGRRAGDARHDRRRRGAGLARRLVPAVRRRRRNRGSGRLRRSRPVDALSPGPVDEFGINAIPGTTAHAGDPARHGLDARHTSPLARARGMPPAIQISPSGTNAYDGASSPAVPPRRRRAPL